METVYETVNLFLEEIGLNPMKFGVEFIQFLLLLLGGYALIVGFGKRRGMLANAVDRQADRTKADLALVASAPSIVESARADAVRIREEATAEADGIVREATMQSTAIRRDAAKEGDEESSAILDRADIALQTERAEMQAEVRDLLVNIVADATRSVMNEKLSLPEQRELIQNAILESVGKASTKRPANRKQIATSPSEVS